MNRKRLFSLVLAASMFSAAVAPAAISAEELPAVAGDAVAIQEVVVYFDELHCGYEIKEGVLPASENYAAAVLDDKYNEKAIALVQDILIEQFDEDGNPVPLNGKLAGRETYTEYAVIQAADGYRFDANVKLNEDGTQGAEIVTKNENSLTVKIGMKAVHYCEDKNYADATCKEPSKETFDCTGCGEHFEEVGEIDPDAHDWGDWTVIKNASSTEKGEWVHTCKLCGTEERIEVPRVYSSVYEPNTSWQMAATVAWRADSSAMDTAAGDVRPATAFVWVDADLKVYDRDGNEIAGSVADYVARTAERMIPAFYVKDGDAASALKGWLSETGFEDCFVVSTPDNKDAVKDVADLLHVRGMLDFTAETNPSRKTLTDMIAAVNGAHGKVVLLNAEAATRENIRLLQSLCATVWVQAPADADTKTLVTFYTHGVNGVLTDDYQAAIRAEELFQDDAPTVLRIPKIIGHRGDPSNYAENTIESARGAFEEGADAIENDIQLSSDGQVFIRHDTLGTQDDPEWILILHRKLFQDLCKLFPAVTACGLSSPAGKDLIRIMSVMV
ncbi:MAG: hypothetical protein IKN55_10450, partial [Oscillospiraceae bacterium]|nr:hypothetical protein [Oscillospiraceae bacterium]